jgi:parvulin-like peptidyl-prolyl isomerase
MEGADFFSLARQYSIDESTRLAGGFVGRIERTQLPQAIAAHAFGAIPGTIAGPFEIDKKFYVVKIEEVYPAELNEATRARIEGILFEEWLSLRRKQANVQIPLWAQE